MKKITYIFLLVSLILVSNIEAQSSRKIWTMANDAFEKSHYYEALDLFLAYSQEKKPDLDTKLKIGISYFFTNEISEGIPYLLEVAQSKKDIHESAIFYLGRAYHSNLDFKNAIKYYKLYLKEANINEWLQKSIISEIKRCRSGMKIKALNEIAYVENLGGLVNDLGDDCKPIFSHNRKGRIYFSSQRKGSVGGLRDDKGIEDYENGQNDYDIYFCDINNGSWSVAKRMPDFVNTVRHDILQDFTSNGRVMQIFRSLNNYSGIVALDTFKKDRKKSLKYYFLESPVKTENGDNDLFYYNDTTLLFSSDREGGFGGRDLYLTQKINNKWSQPVNLGPQINSVYDEVAPYLANDGQTLFFSSNNLKSMGGHDIFYATIDMNLMSFKTPINLGLPINSAADDLSFRLDNSGMKGVFCSARKQGYGKRDLYMAFMKSKLVKAPQKSYPFIVDLYEQHETVIEEEETVKIVTHKIAPLFYTDDDDVLSIKNEKALEAITEIMVKHPFVDLSIEVYSDDVDAPNALNLFFSIKKSQQIKEYLIEKNIESSRISLKGMGKNYPLALDFLNNKPYLFGKKMNQRIEFKFNTHHEKNLVITYEKPTIPENIKIGSNELLKKRLKGLYFRIEIANIDKVYQGEELESYEDPYVELLGEEQSFRYCVGLGSKFSPIKILYKGIQKRNKSAQIVPYFEGQRISILDLKKRTKRDKQAKAYLDFISKNN